MANNKPQGAVIGLDLLEKIQLSTLLRDALEDYKKGQTLTITDTGGLTSHAAIISRELQKPCIIGTKIATKVLKDGDVVEVDAEKGIVKILKN